MIETTQSTRPAKPVRTARKTAPKRTRAPFRKPKSLSEVLHLIASRLPPGFDLEKERDLYLRKKYGLK